jgi:Ca2+-binding EF-hand superfamily protein
MAKQLSPGELEQLRATFDDFDKDHNGTLDKSELGAVLAAFLSKKPSARQLQRIFTAADADKNGSIDFGEFVAVLNKVRLDEYTERKAVFDALDTDKNGVIDTSEFCAACARLGLTLTRPEVEVLLEHYDKNGDKVVDFQEFGALIASLE